MDRSTKNLIGACKHVSRPMALTLVPMNRSTSDQQIGGVTFVNRRLVAEDLRLSVVAVHGGDFETLCCSWRHVDAQVGLIFAEICRSMDDLLFEGSGWLNQ